MHEISENFKTIAEKSDFKVAYKPMNTLKSVIRLGKDKLDMMEHCNVIYKIIKISSVSLTKLFYYHIHGSNKKI